MEGSMNVITDTIRLLLIEDDADAVHLFSEAIISANNNRFLVTSAGTLGEAMNYMDCNDVDVVIADLNLPDVDGVDTVPFLRKAFPSIPIIVFSGLDDDGAAVQAIQEGADEYLVKGVVDGRRIVRAIQFAVARRLRDDERSSSLGGLLKKATSAVRKANQRMLSANGRVGSAVKKIGDLNATYAAEK